MPSMELLDLSRHKGQSISKTRDRCSIHAEPQQDFCSFWHSLPCRFKPIVTTLVLFTAVLHCSWALILGSAGGALGSGCSSDAGAVRLWFDILGLMTRQPPLTIRICLPTNRG